MTEEEKARYLELTHELAALVDKHLAERGKPREELTHELAALVDKHLAARGDKPRELEYSPEYDPGHYILIGHTAVYYTGHFLEWAMWFELYRAERIVKQEHIGPYFVSTIFLGLDHGFGRIYSTPEEPNPRPILFETMVFHNVGGQGELTTQKRCSTWEEAEQQHAEIAAKFRIAASS